MENQNNVKKLLECIQALDRLKNLINVSHEEMNKEFNTIYQLILNKDNPNNISDIQSHIYEILRVLQFEDISRQWIEQVQKNLTNVSSDLIKDIGSEKIVEITNNLNVEKYNQEKKHFGPVSQEHMESGSIDLF